MTTIANNKKTDSKTDKKIIVVNGGKKSDSKTVEPKPEIKTIVIPLLTPNDFAKQFECDSKKIRVILRKHKISKNDDGKYGWSQTKYDEIAKIIKTEIDANNEKYYDPTKTDSTGKTLTK